MTTKTTVSSTGATKGSLKITILRASKLPTLDFGESQYPFVTLALVPLVKTTRQQNINNLPTSHSFCRTEALKVNGNSPIWTEDMDRNFELFYDSHQTSTVLTVCVYKEGRQIQQDELIGTGSVNLEHVVSKQLKHFSEYTVSLKDGTEGLGGSRSTESRGELKIQVAFGPPVRKALRAVSKASKVLTYRDNLMGALGATKDHVSDQVMKNVISGPKEFAKKHKTLCLAGGSGVLLALAGFAAIAISIALGMGTMAFFTFPFWISPALLTSFASAPLWIPMLAAVVLFLFGAFVCFALLAITTPRVRQKGNVWVQQFKSTSLGQKLVYDIMEEEEEKHTE